MKLVDWSTLGILGAAIAFAVTLLMEKVLLPVACRFDVMDHPKGRKDHSVPTPVIGGVAMLVGIVLATLSTLKAIDASTLGFLWAGVLLVIVGLLDDKFDLHWKVRIFAQIVAALLMIFVGGVRVEYIGQFFGLENIILGPLSVPFTVFATVGAINAVNMVDGADGLAGLLVAAAVAMLAAAALYCGNLPIFANSLIVLGAVCAFLVYNIRHRWQRCAKSFMGNAGSALLGLTIAWIAFQLTQNPAHPVTPILALWLIPVPIIDCLVLIVRRVVLRQSPFCADRNHIHHLMLDAGFTPTRAAIALAAFSCACGLSAALLLLSNWSHNYLLIGFFGLCAIWYWLTAKRSRALAFFRATRIWKGKNEPSGSRNKAAAGAKGL